MTLNPDQGMTFTGVIGHHLVHRTCGGSTPQHATPLFEVIFAVAGCSHMLLPQRSGVRAGIRRECVLYVAGHVVVLE